MPNQLQYETSPYLLQHAHNPVNWYPWGEEAFALAKELDRPVLVSIGYSSCHWCHVMERESFEDAEVAAFMNDHFVNIKVDREERPDVDHIYMEACQAISGSGGWPLNCFVMPDRRPFYAGTYYPPSPAYNRPSWMNVLVHLSKAWQNQRADVVGQAEKLMDTIARAGDVFVQKDDRLALSSGQQLHPVLAANIFHELTKRFDRAHGGFGGAPKFPATMSLHYLLDYYFYNGDADALAHVHFSLEKMIRGGIYDQLGGGFARYATDQAWLVPHFEKMLYDNALLVELMSKVYRLDPKPIYAQAIHETLAFVARELSDPEGGFYAALDADSEGVEGKFYVWDQEEIEEVLQDDAQLFKYHYGVRWDGNWEGVNILWQAHSLEESAAKFGMSVAAASRLVEGAKQLLLERRSQRQRPGLDNKQLLDWSALMVTAYAEAAMALNSDVYRDQAVKQLAYLQRAFTRPDGGLFHQATKGQPRQLAFLDDYAYLIQAMLAVYQLTFDANHLVQAGRLMTYVLEHFLDESDGLLYFTDQNQSDVPVRRKELYDSATPSGNATMAHNLLQLSVLTGNTAWGHQAERMLSAMSAAVERYASSFSRWAQAMQKLAWPSKELAIVGPDAIDEARALLASYRPNCLIMAAADDNPQFPLLAGRLVAGKTVFYVCEQYACRLPVERREEALDLISQRSFGLPQ